jgi:hypothetical protein
MADRWTYASAGDAVDAICDGEAPWLAAMSDDAFADLLDVYKAEQELVHAGVAALEAHANEEVNRGL